MKPEMPENREHGAAGSCQSESNKWKDGMRQKKKFLKTAGYLCALLLFLQSFCLCTLFCCDSLQSNINVLKADTHPHRHTPRIYNTVRSSFSGIQQVQQKFTQEEPETPFAAFSVLHSFSSFLSSVFHDQSNLFLLHGKIRR